MTCVVYIFDSLGTYTTYTTNTGEIQYIADLDRFWEANELLFNVTGITDPDTVEYDFSAIGLVIHKLAYLLG